MKNFIKIEDKTISFGDCKNCDAYCCKGSYGSIFSQILKDEFEELYPNFPILFIFGSLGFVKPIILLSDGFNSCPYLKNSSCSIYINRPIVCKNYPLSPNIDNEVYIDNSCPEVFKKGKLLDIKSELFSNYQEKYIETHLEFENLANEDFKLVCTIKNEKFYKYIGKNSSKYLKYHKLSLSNLDKIFV